MKHILSAVIGSIVIALATVLGRAQEATWEYAVQVSATVQTSPPQIKLSWPQDTRTTPTSYTVYRKAPSATSWGTGNALPGTTTTYTDSNVAVGSTYEYQIVKQTSLGYSGYGYIVAGIQAPLVDSRGKVILVVDNTYASNLANELVRLQQDLVGDGWSVIRHDVARTDTPASVKSLIKADYNADPANVKAVFLFGRVPVLRSGNLNVDGHQARPMPADVFYGDMDGSWTDGNGDGIYDQSYLPSDVDLQVGRVDFANMPGKKVWNDPGSFPSEVELLRQYLNKDHNFRHKLMTAPLRGLVGNRFGDFGGEAFAASGYRNFSTFFGAGNTTTANASDTAPLAEKWISYLQSNSYLWAYGCGGGSATSISGLGTNGLYSDVWSTDIVAADAKAVFNMQFGSWLCDWDTQDNIMRSTLVTSTMGLTCSWSGRPHHYYHPMALGETAGYGIRLSQNNSGLYKNQYNAETRGVHIALMGDPTLRMHAVAPASGLSGSVNSSGAFLSWSPSSEPVLGYHVYRANNSVGPFTRVTSSIVAGTSFTDTAVTSGSYSYMVRSVKLENTPSGTYYNASQGAITTVNDSNPTPTPTLPTVTIQATDANAAEAGLDAGVFTITRSGSTTSALTVNYTLGGSAQSGSDYATLATSVSLPIGAASTTVVVTPIDDTLVEGAETVTLTLASSASYSLGSPSTATVTIADNDSAPAPAPALPTLTVIASDATATEGSSDPGVFTFTRTGDTSNALTVNYALNGTAIKWSDYRRLEGDMPVSITIPAGASSATLTIYAFDDTEVEPTETVVLSITPDPAYNAGTPSSATVSIADNDSAVVLPTVTVAAPDPNAAEAGLDSGTFTISRSGSTTTALTVNYSVTGSATGGSDYASLASSVTIPIGAASATVTVTPVDDSLVEGNESVTLTINPSADYTVATSNSASVIIADNDSAPAPTPTLPTVTVTATDANATEGNSDPGVFTFARTGDTSAPLTVNYALNGTAIKWTDYRRLEGDMPVSITIPAGASSATLTIFAFDDADVEGSETVILSISADAAYTVGSPSTATVTIADNDSAPAPTPTLPAVTVTATDANAAEAGLDPGIFTITRTGGTTTALTVNYAVSGTASAGSDYNTLATSVTLPIGAASATILVVPIDDSLVEGNETVILTLVSDAAYTVGSPSNATITVADNDSAPVPPPSPNPPPSTASVTDYTNLQLPKPGDNTLHVLSPTVLELVMINTKQPDPATVDCWNFVNSTFQFQPPALTEFAVTANGQPVAVQTVGFKRRAFYAPNSQRDLRIGNYLYLQLASAVADNQTVEVKNPNGTLWPSTKQFSATVSPLRYSPAIHVNQEGYVPAFPKKAMIGYYLGNLGEMDIAASLGFQLIDANTGAKVHQGSLVLRQDFGYTYTPTPYQKVLVADFTSFNTPGEYRLLVPGLGASLPFLIDDGVAMSFARAYALGLYHQRCGTNNAMPFTRFTHDPCHIALASIPSPQSSFVFTWNTISNYSGILNNENPAQIAPRMIDEASQLFPFVNKGTLDVSGGHHDAGDYSKYTINSTRLIHQLMFAADALPGVGALDNLGIPESGDGISDLMQEAKWEADFLAKMQDADGGFYTLVYPQNREYENNVTPDHGDPQVVWPKTTSVTAASVAALAQCASSPRFKQQYPAEAAAYLQKAQLGWNFLMNAIAKYGKDGSYQKTIHYGDNFTHNDELAWAACEMFLATGDPAYQQKLLSWFDPSDSATWRWTWWRMSEGYGNAIRSFAFAAKTGRLQSSQLDATFLSKCQTQILAAGDDALTWSNQSAYGSSFPDATKRVMSAGWYFSVSQAYDIAVAYQLNPKPEYLEALVANMNYEGGVNPINVTYVTGMGWKRQREIVHQYAVNDRHALPPSGIPLGNIQTGFVWLAPYGTELGALNFPQDSASTAPYPFYDRWGDSYNVTTEFVNVDQARGLANLAFLATLTSTKAQAWQCATAQITVPTEVPVNTAVTATVQVPNMDLSVTRIVWEAQGQEPAYGSSYTFTPSGSGSQWVEVEVQWPDGRRAFGATSFSVTNGLPNVSVAATDAQAAEAGPDPAVFTFTRSGDTSSALTVNYTFSGTATKWNDYRRLEGDIPVTIVIPAGAASATLTVYPVDDTEVEGNETIILSLLPDAAYNVGASASASATIADNDSAPSSLPTVSVAATDANAAEAGLDTGVFTITRAGSTTSALTVNYSLSGTATSGSDYNAVAASVTLPIGAASATVVITPIDDTIVEGNETVVLTITPNAAYTVGATASATVTIADNDTALPPPTISVVASDANAAEAGSDPGVFTFTRAGDTSKAITVNYALTGTAIKWTDYRRLEGDMPVSIIIPAGAASATLTIYPFDDAEVEGSETVVLTLTPDPAYAVGSPSTATVSIVDNDSSAPPPPPTISVVATDASASEAGSDPAVFTFTRAGDTNNAITVNYSLGGTAVKWTDYRRLEGDMPVSISIPAGATSATLTIYPFDDTEVEGTETVILAILPDPAYAVGSPNSATVSIADNDFGSTVNVVANDASASRIGPDLGQFTFTRTGSTANALTVNYALGGTAIKWTDYRTPNGDMPVSITIPAGASSTTMTIVPQPSASLVDTQTVILTLVADAAYTVGTPSSATINIDGNSVTILSTKTTGSSVTLTWASLPGKIYRVAYKNTVNDANWTDLSGNITATGSTTSWTDKNANKFTQRIYAVYVVN